MLSAVRRDDTVHACKQIKVGASYKYMYADGGEDEVFILKCPATKVP